MDSQDVENNAPSSNTHYLPHRCCASTAVISHIDHNSTNSNDNVIDANDHTTLVFSGTLKSKGHNCHCSLLAANKSKSSPHFQPWISLVHISCTAVLAFLAVYLVSNVLIFGQEMNEKEMDDIAWRSYSTEENYTTLSSVMSTTMPTTKDKCEPLYVLVYANCFVWFLFLILDHVARHVHNKILRSRGHLRAHARLSRLAAIPFQLVSLWTVLLAIFIAVYEQQDEADMQPYCDANMLMSPKNGIAVLLVIEFICVTITSLLYANSFRKFNFEKPPPDVCGWDESNYCDRWTPHVLQSNDATLNEQPNSERFSYYEQRDGRCLLDLLDYYAHANHELAENLSKISERLHQLEIEKQSQQPSQSLD